MVCDLKSVAVVVEPCFVCEPGFERLQWPGVGAHGVVWKQAASRGVDTFPVVRPGCLLPRSVRY